MHKIFKTTFLLLVLFAAGIVVYPRTRLISVPPTVVSDTLSSSQLSYFARLGVGNTYGETFVRIGTSGNPSNTTSNLFVGDTIAIAFAGGSHLYSVADIGNTALFQVNIGLSALDSNVSNYVVATRSAVHTVAFTPQSAVAGGAWEFLIKASTAADEKPSDGMPDREGFDIGSTQPGGPSTGLGTRLTAADVTCPFGTAEVGTTAQVNGASYHVIACNLDAGINNAIGTGVTMVVGRDLATGSQLINPSPNHSVTTEGNADVYTFYIRHRDASDAIIDADTIQGKIAVVESVRVTATVDPTLTFSIDNTDVGSGATVCGRTLGSNAANTTASSVAFGSIGLSTFNDLAHRLSAVTNSTGGYTVTVYQTGPMTNVSTGTGTTIADTNCDGGCSYTSENAWTTDNTHSEWGYSLQNINATSIAFNYGSGVSYNAKAFGQGPAQAQMIFQNTETPATTERAYICYRLTASTTQEAGKYETKLVYTATAKF